MKVFEAVGKCSYRRADSIRDRRPTADYRIGIHPQLANVDLAVYGDLAVGRVVILNNPPVRCPTVGRARHDAHHGVPRGARGAAQSPAGKSLANIRVVLGLYQGCINGVQGVYKEGVRGY